MVLGIFPAKGVSIKQLYAIYFKYLLPLIGKLIFQGPKGLPLFIYESSSAFPCYEDFEAILRKIGFHNTLLCF